MCQWYPPFEAQSRSFTTTLGVPVHASSPGFLRHAPRGIKLIVIVIRSCAFVPALWGRQVALHRPHVMESKGRVLFVLDSTTVAHIFFAVKAVHAKALKTGLPLADLLDHFTVLAFALAFATARKFVGRPTFQDLQDGFDTDQPK